MPLLSLAVGRQACPQSKARHRRGASVASPRPTWVPAQFQHRTGASVIEPWFVLGHSSRRQQVEKGFKPLLNTLRITRPLCLDYDGSGALSDSGLGG